MLDRSRGREIPGRPSLPRPLPKPERQLNPRSRRMRDGHRDPVDPHRDRLSYQRRLERSLVDVGLYRSVSFRDLAEAYFDGHPYVARRAVNQWIRAGAFKETTARGRDGKAAADIERMQAAQDLGLSVDQQGKVHYPDVQIEYTDADGRTDHVNVEVATNDYRNRSIQAKAAAGFVIHGNGRGGARVSKAFGRSGSKGIRGLGQKGDPPAGGTRGPTDRGDGSVEL